MKATCNREGLSTAFQVVAAVVPARSPKPILRNVKLEVNGDATVLSATDLELGIRYRVSGVTPGQEGRVILPAAHFMSILRESGDETIELEETESGIRIQGASSRFELPSEDPLQFPDVPDFGNVPARKIKSGAFATMVRRTVFAVASENSRYALHAVRLEFENDRAIMVATDGKRLALMPGSATTESPIPEGHALIPPKAVALLQKVLSDPDEDVEIALDQNDVLFRTSKVIIYSRLVEGRFPRYQDVFPSEAKITIPLIVGEFLGAVRQARIVTSENSKGVDFRFESGQIVMESRSADVGQSEVRLPIGYEGETVEITIDPQLLIDALRVLEPTEEVRFDLIDGKTAAVLRTDDDFAYVVMPLTREQES